MIEEIVEIGDILIGDFFGNEVYLAVLIEEIEVFFGNEKNFVVKIDFFIKEKIIIINCVEEVKDSIVKDYVYVGFVEGLNFL